MAMSAHSEWLDQFEEGNAAGGHASEVEAIPYPAVSPSMTSRRFRAPWRANTMPGGYVVRCPCWPRLFANSIRHTLDIVGSASSAAP
jgi:hypothetical protein